MQKEWEEVFKGRESKSAFPVLRLMPIIAFTIQLQVKRVEAILLNRLV